MRTLRTPKTFPFAILNRVFLNTVDAVVKEVEELVVEPNVYEFEEEDLVEYVKQYPIIWNKKDENHKDTRKNYIVWENITKNLNSSGKLSIF